jgi:type IV secretion system protein VirB9
MKQLFLFACIFCIVSACATIDVEKSVRLDAGAGNVKDGNTGSAEPVVVAVPIDQGPPEIIVIEKPFYIPPGTPYQPPSAAGRDAVKIANDTGIVQPSEYSRAAIVYDFDPDWVYEVYTQPLRATDIRLERGERAMAAPFISDSERWMIGAGVSYETAAEVQHFYIKPIAAGLEASLIINTDRRVYHIILRSFRDIHMPMVRWRYPSSGMPNNFVTSTPPSAASAAPGETPEAGGGIDPRFLSFNYRITYGFFSKPKWLPTLVYDDGQKTYITFPQDVLQSELPTVFENRSSILNYRVMKHIIIIDKLVQKITVKNNKQEIVIEKKRTK